MPQAVRSETRHPGRTLLAVHAPARHPGEVPSCLTRSLQSFGPSPAASITTRVKAPHGQDVVRRRSVKHSTHHGRDSPPLHRSGRPSQSRTGGGSTLPVAPSCTGSEARAGSGIAASPWAIIWNSPSTSFRDGRGWPVSSRSRGSGRTGRGLSMSVGRGAGGVWTRGRPYSCHLRPTCERPTPLALSSPRPAARRTPAGDGTRPRAVPDLSAPPRAELRARSSRACP